MTGNVKPTPPAAAGGTNPAVSTTTACTATHGIFHMHMDADRDGNVDDDCTGLNSWVWGKNKRGAIILCNNDDDDDSAGTLDNADDKINGGNDKDEIAPLEFRKVAGTTPPATMEGYIEVSMEDAQRIRIFDGRAAGAKEIIGPTAGKSYKFPNMSFDAEKYGMEAVIYAGINFGGLITITFIVKDSGVEKYREKGVVRVAPWIMPNHNDSALKAFVVDAGSSNSRFRSELNTMVVAAGCTLDQSHASNDIWMQDCMEIGYSNLSNIGFHVVTRAPRNRPLKVFPKNLLAVDFGYNEVGTLSSHTTFDSTGNLEATPPCTSEAGKKYPLGRIYYGPGRPLEEIDPDFKAFLEKQIIQEPIEVDTSWLVVGHVDEIISFVPAPGGKGFKMLLASPKLAYKILRDNSASHGSAKLLTARSFPGHGSAEVSISDFLNTGIPGLGHTSASLNSFNTDKQIKLDIVKQLFKKEIGIDPATDIIEVPILFMPNPGLSNLADALTAGMVNMLVLNKHCITPKPFGPVIAGKDLYEEDIKNKLTPLGLTVKFLDDWMEYHVNLGEVHCGTNTLRAPKMAKWWEFEP